jgi:hypothetical protein
MKRHFAAWLVLVAACFQLYASEPARTTRPRLSRVVRRQKAKPDSYPKMRAAIAALEAAKAELESTRANFGGHKSEAVDSINNALKRLRLALQFEKY